MTAIDLSSYAGLTAITLLTFNILIGLLLSIKYNPVRRWPHRRINTVQVHNWTGYAALSAAIVHPAVILLSATERFRLVDIAYPLNAPKQPGINTFGAAALYILIFTVATSYFRFDIGRRWWKKMHLMREGIRGALCIDRGCRDGDANPLAAEAAAAEGSSGESGESASRAYHIDR